MLHFRNIDATRKCLFPKSFPYFADSTAEFDRKTSDSGAKTADFEPEESTDSLHV